MKKGETNTNVDAFIANAKRWRDEPGRQRAYIYHFSAPRQSRTREARVRKFMPHILKGKGLNDE